MAEQNHESDSNLHQSSEITQTQSSATNVGEQNLSRTAGNLNIGNLNDNNSLFSQSNSHDLTGYICYIMSTNDVLSVFCWIV